MSWFEPTDVTCPQCGHAFKCGTAESINVSRMPWAKAQLVAGSFHQPDCPACGGLFHVDREFLYTDFEQWRFVQVFPLDDQGDWPALETLTEEVFESVCAEGPPFVQAMPERFTVRTCFGLRALGEKIRLWDAGLDDALVELLKLELVARTPDLEGRPTLELSVVAVSPDLDRLEIEAWDREGDADRIVYAVAMRRYRELAAAKDRLIEDFPGLFYRPFRAFRRLLRETATPQERPEESTP